MLARRLAACALPTGALAFHDHKLGSLTAVVDGKSMHPTFNGNGSHGSRDRILLNRLFTRVERGDIIVLRSPSDDQHLLIKRVIGIEGDSVQRKEGSVVVIPSGHVWVEGDNKACSIDSRQFGPVKHSLVEARVVAKVWPIKDACLITREEMVPAVASGMSELRSHLSSSREMWV